MPHRTLLSALFALASIAACDLEPPERAALEARPDALHLRAPSTCDGACSELHCENVTRVRDEHADADLACEVECLDIELACLHAPNGPHCGTCEHDAAECMTACLDATDESTGP
jgi:hypothetical protein